MDSKHYYISYFDRCEQSLRYPDIIIEKLLNYDIAISYYNSTVINDFENVIEIKPILITNNENLYKQYRHILSENDFQAFCYDNLSNYKGLSGTIGEDAFNHFLNIRTGKYNTAYQSRTMETWDDERSGYSYDYETNEGWKTTKEMLTSLIIEQDLKQKYNNI